MSVNPRLKATKIIGVKGKHSVHREFQSLAMHWKNCQVDIPQEKGSGTSWASCEEHLPK